MIVRHYDRPEKITSKAGTEKRPDIQPEARLDKSVPSSLCWLAESWAGSQSDRILKASVQVVQLLTFMSSTEVLQIG
jgi:hypothetical protein